MLALLFGGVSLPAPGVRLTESQLAGLTRGEVCVVRDWLPRPLITALRADAVSLHADGAFKSSGLSNQAKGGRAAQAFGESDRSVLALTPKVPGDTAARADFGNRLDALRSQLSASLGRKGLVCAEQYYSLSRRGARLPLHMDERHEEAKGRLGWTNNYRRSLSWLVYLCEDGWDGQTAGSAQTGAADGAVDGAVDGAGAGAGGALRAWMRDGVRPGLGATCGAHQGNLQVGWRAATAGQEPVYLDAWQRVPHPSRGLPESPSWLAQSCLYRVDDEGVRSDLCAPVAVDNSLAAERRCEGLPEELWAALPKGERDRFSSIESVEAAAQKEMRVSPIGGTLVLFDSVVVPHEVTETLAGDRWAMAGWLHEAQQPFPEWFFE